MKQNYNNESLASLGHGKWKSALRCTLLLIGLLAFGANSAWAQPDPSNPNIPEGLRMSKEYIPDDIYDGSSGVIRLETFVTGHSVAEHVPTDIVLVLDVSGSMDQNMTNYTYTARNSQAYSYSGYNNTYYIKYKNQYYPVVRQDYTTGNWPNQRHYYRLRFQVGDNWHYLRGTTITDEEYFDITQQNTTIWTGVLYSRSNNGQQNKLAALKNAVLGFVDNIAEDAEQHEVDHRISIVKYAMNSYPEGDDGSSIAEGNDFDNNNYNYTQVLLARRNPVDDYDDIEAAVNGLRASGATAADYGMNKARHLLASIPDDEFEERTKVVVLFTDGAPTYSNSFQQAVATNTISNAYNLKHSWTYNNKTYDFNAQVYTIGVFSLSGNDLTQVNNYMHRVSNNFPNATSYDNGGTQESEDYYFKAESSEGLNEIFDAIAGASGAMSLPAATIVQDAVSPSFQLPEGASGTVLAYAPKFTGINATTGEYEFEALNDNGTLHLTNGVVDNQGSENKLPSNFVTVNGNTIQMSGFNFSEHWCGYITDDNGQNTPNPNGRKIVLMIPIEIADGSWGDGIVTNNPAESYIKTPDPNNPGQFIYYGPFNTPSANVLGSVWTEVVTTRPTTFPEVTSETQTIEIGTPEDLAWFISEVNGRIGYNVHEGEANTNKVASHPKLNGKLTADIDMSAHNWVPIGCGWQVEIDPNSTEGLTRFKEVNGEKVHMVYEGTFDGNGHVITGLKNNASKFYKQIVQNQGGVVVFPGMFSDVKGTIKNVFVLDADFRGKHHNQHFVHHGIIADTLEAGGNIFNCEAAGRITCNNDNPTADQNLIYGGLVGLNQGTVHSCMAMAELTGYTLGGMIGENGQGTSTTASFSNGFTNGVYNYLGSDNAYKVGGIAGTNAGTIDNCYVRFERDNTNLNKATFGMLIGSGTAPTNSYIPQIVTWSRPNTASVTIQTNTNSTVPTNVTTPSGNPTNSYTLSVSPSFYNMFTNDNATGGTWGTVTNSQGTFNVYNNGTSLLTKLNQGKGNGAAWKRTTAGRYTDDNVTGYVSGDINDDYPVLAFEKFGTAQDDPKVTCLGSSDGIRIDYATSLDEMLDRHNNYTVNTNSTWNNNKYKNTQVNAIKGGAINLYANDNTTRSTSATVGTVVYIDEDISLLQDASSSIDAYTAQTLKSFIPNSGESWHFVSSSLEDSEFGWSYGTDDNIPFSWDNEDPCVFTMNRYDEDHALFPIDLISYKREDFYCFDEPNYHWINFKRNSASHYHMDFTGEDIPANHAQITYTNETSFTQGKGYLMAIDMSTYASYNRNAQFVQNRGTLNNGNVQREVTYTAGNEWTGLAGYNLLGNPYQSYLDFDAFVTGNTELWAEGDEFAQTYAVYNPANDAYLQYAVGGSAEALVASRYLNMHQGFFIKTSQTGENAVANFTNAMRTNNPGTNYPGFRGEENHYPLINFMLNDNESGMDVAVLEVGRPENGGAKKLRVKTTNGHISLRYDNKNFAILFRDMTEGSQPLYFDTEEDGMFTLSWNTANADFRELTLVDNITGVRYDMLTHDSYVFEGHANDYKSRFKVVIGSFTGVEEEETVTNNFAFFDGSEWVVNGQGRLTVTDMMGRMVYGANLENDQNRVNLNGVAQGMYLMQVSNGNGSRVQKIVVR